MEVHQIELEHYEAAIQAMEGCITMLHDQAVRLSDLYLAFIEQQEASKDQGSGIQLSVVRKGNHIEIKWTGIKWYGPRGKRFSKWIPIPKSKENLTYTRERLRMHANEWELEMVMQTEEKMTRIRKKASHIVKGIMSMRNAIRVAKADGDAAFGHEGIDDGGG